MQAAGVAIHPLTQAERIGLLNEDALHAQSLREIAGGISLVEQMEVGAEDDLRETFIDEPRHAHADAVHAARDTAEQFPAPLLERIEQFGVAFGSGEPPRLILRDVSVETSRDHAADLGVDHHAQHGGRFRRHPHEPAGPAERRLEGIELLDKAAFQE